MIFTKLSAKNCLSYHSLEFDLSVPGMTFLCGINGAGKTGILRILTWILWGKTQDDPALSGREMVSRGKDFCEAFVIVMVDEFTGFRIMRTVDHPSLGSDVFVDEWKYGLLGSSLTRSSKKETTELVEELLGMDYSTFCNSVIFGQGSIHRFTTSTEGERKKIFDRALNVEFLPQGLKTVRMKLNEVGLRMSQLEEMKKSTLGQLSLAKQLVEQVVSERSSFNRHLDSELALRIKSLDDMEQMVSKEFNDLLYYSRMMAPLVRMFPAIEYLETLCIAGGDQVCLDDGRQYEDIDRELSITRAELRSIGDELIDIDCKRSDLYLAVKSGKPCELCGRSITAESASTTIKNLSREYESLETKRSELESRLASLEKDSSLIRDLMAASASLSNVHRKMVGKIDEIGHLRRYIRKVIGNLNELHCRINEAEDGLYVRDSLQVPDSSKFVECFKTVATLLSDLVSIDVEYWDLVEEASRLKFWEQAYSNSGIKSMIIDSVIPFLNQKANEYSSILTDGEIRIEISAKTKLKSGDSRDRIDVICSRVGRGESYAALSGGEKRRVDICISLAIRELIGSRGNRPISLIFLDEVFESLDDIGVERTIELLHYIASSDRSVFVITHHGGLQEYFENVMFVVNKNGKSKVVSSAA